MGWPFKRFGYPYAGVRERWLDKAQRRRRRRRRARKAVKVYARNRKPIGGERVQGLIWRARWPAAIAHGGGRR